MVAVKSRPNEREQLKLRLKVDEILAGPAAPLQVSTPLPTAFEPEPEEDELPPSIDREPFGRWLIAQKDRGDWIDDLPRRHARIPVSPRMAAPTTCAGI